MDAARSGGGCRERMQHSTGSRCLQSQSLRLEDEARATDATCALYTPLAAIAHTIKVLINVFFCIFVSALFSFFTALSFYFVSGKKLIICSKKDNNIGNAKVAALQPHKLPPRRVYLPPCSLLPPYLISYA